MSYTGYFSSGIHVIYEESDGEILHLFQNSASKDWTLELEGIGQLKSWFIKFGSNEGCSETPQCGNGIIENHEFCDDIVD